LDGPSCLACGHVPLTAAEQARVPALMADVAAAARAELRSDAHQPRPRPLLLPDAERLFALAAAPEGVTRPQAKCAIGHDVAGQLESMVRIGQLVREQGRTRTGSRVWVYRPVAQG